MSFDVGNISGDGLLQAAPLHESQGAGQSKVGEDAKKVSLDSGSAILDPVKKNNNGWGGWALNKLAGNWVGEKIVENSKYVRDGAIYALIGTTDFDAVSDEQLDRLKRASRNTGLGRLVDAFIPFITDKIKEKVITTYPGFEAFLNLEKGIVEKIVRSVLLKVVANVADQVAQKQVNTKPAPDFNEEFVKFLMGMANDEIAGNGKDFDAKFDEIDGMTATPNAQKYAFRELFKPVVAKFLDVCLPKGKEDLGLRGPLATAVWSALADEALPDAFVDFYRLMHKPNHHTEDDLAVLSRPGGAALQAIAKFAGEKGKGVIPKVMAEESEEISLAAFEKAGVGQGALLRKLLAKIIRQIAKSGSPELLKFWDYAKINIESIMIHALATLAKKQDAEGLGNVIPVVAGTGLKIIDDFFSENAEKIDEAIEKWAPYPKKKRNEEVAKLFKPLSDQILKETGLEDNMFVKLIKDKAFPSLLRRFYDDMKKYAANKPQFEARLKKELVDEQAMLNQPTEEVKQHYDELVARRAEPVQDVLAERSGVEKVVQDLSKSCGMLAEDVMKIVKNFARTDKEEIARRINQGLFAEMPLTAQQENELAEGLNQFMASGGEGLEHAFAYSESLLQATIFKIFVVIAENNPVADKDIDANRTENKNVAIPGNVIHRVLSFLSEKIPAIDQRLNEIKNSDLEESEKQRQCVALFRPLVDDFLQLAGPNLREALPVPKVMRDLLMEKVQQVFLPAIFHEVYTQLNGWRNEIPANKGKLDEIFPSGNGKSAAGKIADYIRDFVPYYMETNPGKIVGVVQGATSKYFDALSPENAAGLKELIERNVRSLGEEVANHKAEGANEAKDPMSETAKAIGEYSRSIILKIFAGVSQNIDGKEKPAEADGKNHFVLTTAIGFIKIAAEHFRRINKIPEKGRTNPAHSVAHEDMLKGFEHNTIDENGNILHPALAKDLDPNATPEQRKQQRMEQFFVPFAENLIAISGIDSKEFPVPGMGRDQVWDLFKKQILPEVLYNVYNEMLQPRNLNKIMLQTLDLLASTANGLADDSEEASSETDLHQKELNKALGGLIKEMIDLVPDFWTKTFFDRDAIMNLTEESLGRRVKSKLDGTTMIALMEKGLAGLKLPKADANRGKSAEQLAMEDKKDEEKLQKKFSAYISIEAKKFVKAKIEEKWDSFQEAFDKGVEKCFGKPGLAVKHFFDDIFHFIFFDLLGPIFNFIVFKMIWFYIELMKIIGKSKEIIGDIHMPIHENLALWATQWLLGVMMGKVNPTAVREEVVKSHRRGTVIYGEEESLEPSEKTEEENFMEDIREQVEKKVEMRTAVEEQRRQASIDRRV